MSIKKLNENGVYYIIIAILCLAIFFLSFRIIDKVFFSKTQDDNTTTIEKQDYKSAVTAYLNIDGEKKDTKSKKSTGASNQTIENIFLRVLLNSNVYMKEAYRIKNNGVKEFGILKPEIIKIARGIEPFSYLKSQFPAILNIVDASKDSSESQHTFNNDQNIKDKIDVSNGNDDKMGELKDIITVEDPAEAGEGVYIYEQSLEQAGIDISQITVGVNVSEIASLFKVKSINVNEDKPYVLLYHTHGTEGYFPNNKTVFHTTNRQYNVTSIGEIITNGVKSRGLNVMHVDTYHDAESFNESYTRSKQTAQRVLREEDNIKVIFDIHRDGVDVNNCDLIEAKNRFTTEINGKQVATFTMVIGPDNPNYDELIRFAQYIKSVSDVMYPGLCRGIIKKNYGKFNQYLSDHYALIEVGSNINSVEEAEESAKLIAEVLNSVVKGIKK